jgi:hypothetical protein
MHACNKHTYTLRKTDNPKQFLIEWGAPTHYNMNWDDGKGHSEQLPQQQPHH